MRTQDCGLFDHKGGTLFGNKLSSWIGSILFHAILVLFILYWFTASTDRSAPGERTAIGSIVLQSGGSGRHQTGTSADEQTTDREIVEAKLANLSNTNVSVLPATHIFAPSQSNTPSPRVDSATGMAQSLQGIRDNSGIGTGEATVQVFGTHGKGTKFMYVFDRSGSMAGVPIRNAKEELILSLDSLGDFHQFNIVFYSGEPQLWQPGRKLIYATPTAKLNATRFVGSITAEGGTNHYPPLREAIDHRPDVIFFLTDGDSQDDPTLRLHEIGRANSTGRKVQINVIQFGSGGLTDAPSTTLQQLAAQNDGEYKYINVTDWR